MKKSTEKPNSPYAKKALFLQDRNFVASSFVAVKYKKHDWKKSCLMEIVERLTLHLVVCFVFPNGMYKVVNKTKIH
jgi:hypothetical protein